MAKERAKSSGKGFLGQWSEQLRATLGYAQRYLNMEPLAILAETSGNFAIENRTIREIKLKLKRIRKETSFHEFEIEVHSTSGKFEFRMDENGDYVKLLKQAYGERVKLPFGYFSSQV